MTDHEKAVLQTAILTIADPRGNWELGWRNICQLSGMDPEMFPAPFRQRDFQTEFRQQPRPNLPDPDEPRS